MNAKTTGKAGGKAAAGATFGIPLGALFGDAIKGWLSAILPLSGAAILTFGAYVPFRIVAQGLLDDGAVYRSVGVDLVGLIISGTLAIPWYSYALDVAAERKVDVRKPFSEPRIYFHQAVASFWFWAAILLGLRYLWGIPSIFALLVYAFHGYFIAEGPSKGGMIALGNSVRLTDGKRIGLFAVAGLLFIFNVFGALGYGAEELSLPVRTGLAAAGLVVTTSITMVAGARMYHTFKKEM